MATASINLPRAIWGSCKASAVAPGGYTSHRNCSDGWTVTPFVATARFLDRHRWQQRTRRRKLELLVRIRECTSPTSPFLLNKTRRRSLKKTKTRSRKLELPVTHMLVRIQLHFSNFPPSLHSLAANLTLDSFTSCILSSRVFDRSNCFSKLLFTGTQSYWTRSRERNCKKQCAIGKYGLHSGNRKRY